MKKINVSSLLVFLLVFTGYAQKEVTSLSKNKDSISKDSLSSKIVKYEDIITGHVKSSFGLFDVHLVDDKYYFEIPDSLLEREILLVNRISKGATGVRALNGMYGYAGTEINNKIITFHKGNGKKLFIKEMLYKSISKDSSENGLYRSVSNSNHSPIIESFDVKVKSPDSLSSLIEVTELLNNDNYLFSLDSQKKHYKLVSYNKQNSYIEDVKSYPENIEIKTVKSFVGENDVHATFELTNSLILLPEEPMQTRYRDDRVGFFGTSFEDYDANPHKVKTTTLANRWRLEPKEKDIQKYLNGELVEPKKPIVFYIDPATPKKWVPYLIKGVNDWQEAFEQAGFKNAIYAKEVTEKDSTWSLNDARHSSIVYMASSVPNAMGPSTTDPRTGEILESHVFWYHNVMTILRNWYVVQAGAIDPRITSAKLDDELMGELIRFVSSHEIGHTIGLMHNFGSSSTVPVEKLRDKKWVEEHGHTPSIMDYARFNYVAQPEDQISVKGIYPRIGDYDKWAIQWGYRWYPSSHDKRQERLRLSQIVTDSINKNPRLWYGPQSPFAVEDPRNQAEVLGDNPMLANTYGIKNLKRILPHLIEWTREEGEDYSELKLLYTSIVQQYVRYITHVLPYFYGNRIASKLSTEEGAVFNAVDKDLVKEAIQFICDESLVKPNWLYNDEIFSRILHPSSQEEAELNSLGGGILMQVMNPLMINLMLDNVTRYGKEQSYSVEELLDVLETHVWSELKTKKHIDDYRRNVQSIYVKSLIELSNDTHRSKTKLLGNIYLNRIKGKIKKAIPKTKDQLSKMHLELLLKDIEESLNAPKVMVATGKSKSQSIFNLESENIFLKSIFSTQKIQSDNCLSRFLEGLDITNKNDRMKYNTEYLHLN